ncbi:hypothetical protein C6P86_23660 [Burkholderia multivorans]|nr:hypothetical protein C6P86_23660 [Burkholderia multivorans]PRE77076.1 hypothetical protein C6Q00_27585 [Burkholderia multivorans]PRG17293.1 hypothetical protein C6T57_26280 [Burkholderia multivorans]
MAFATELHFENWLLYWAQPDVKRLVPHSPRLTCMYCGYRMGLSPDLFVEREGVEIQVVSACVTPASEARARTLAYVGRAHGFAWSVRTPELIRSRPVLLANLDRLLQCATIHVDECGTSIWRMVAASVSDASVMTRGQIRARIHQEIPDTLIDAVLVRMQAAGLLSIELEETRYDEHTLIHPRGAR